MNYKHGNNTKVKKQALNDIKEAENTCFVYLHNEVKKLPKETKINIDTTKL